MSKKCDCSIVLHILSLAYCCNLHATVKAYKLCFGIVYTCNHLSSFSLTTDPWSSKVTVVTAFKENKLSTCSNNHTDVHDLINVSMR